MVGDPVLIKNAIQDLLANHSLLADDPAMVLIWETGGFPAILKKNAAIGTALKLRGHRTHMVICDGTPVACIQRELGQNEALKDWRKKCQGCCLKSRTAAEQCEQEYSLLGDYVSADRIEALGLLAGSVPLDHVRTYRYLDIAVGAMAWCSFNRYLKGLSYRENEMPPEMEKIYRLYFYASLVTTEAASKALQKLEPRSLLSSHGVYVDYAPAAALATLQKRRVLTWTSGYKDFLHYFNVPRTPDALVRGISPDAWSKRAAKPLTTEEDQRLDEYFHARYFSKNSRDIAFQSPPEARAQLKEKLGIRNDNPIVCLFTHVNWDALFEVADMIFPTGNDWAIESIRRMIDLKDLNWIIRVHPAETSLGSVGNVGDIISELFPSLPNHIKLLRADAEINSYGLFQLIDAGITICGTIGVELAVLGKPVVVAGGAHYSHKGFSFDATSQQHYFALLQTCKDLKPLSESEQQLARRYAYSFLVERQIPLRFSKGHFGELELDRLPDLLPGENPVLDMLCKRILDGKDVILSPSRVEALSKPTVTSTSQSAGSAKQLPPAGCDSNASSTRFQLEAFSRFEARDWVGALSKFEQLSALNPDRQGHHLMQARCHIHLGQSGQAVEALQTELRIQPNHPDALQLLRELNTPGAVPRLVPDPARPGMPRFEIRIPPLVVKHSSLNRVPTTEVSTEAKWAPSEVRACVTEQTEARPGNAPVAFSTDGVSSCQESGIQKFGKLVSGLSLKGIDPLCHTPQRTAPSMDPSHSKLFVSAMNRPMVSLPAGQGNRTAMSPLAKLLGFDPAGEVFTDGGRILRGIFPGMGSPVRKILQICQQQNLFERGVVSTQESAAPDAESLGYDLVLEHRKVPFISYAHEWPTEMLKAAALFQIDLSLELDRHGLVLKDCGANSNVLFEGSQPVFVDFLSIIHKEDLEQQEFLKPREVRSPFQQLWSQRASTFNEIYIRMFYPYCLYPLYMQHQKRLAETRRRILATTLNTCFEVISWKETFASAEPDLRKSQERALAARELALIREDWTRFLRVLRSEVEALCVNIDQSNYTNYYQLKKEDFDFEPSSPWLPKQRSVYEAIQTIRPRTVLDIGANTGWFSILAAKLGCQVVSLDNDEASMNVLYKLAREQNLPILPLVLDACEMTPDVPPFAGYESDPHVRNSRLPGAAPLLLSAEKRLSCDLVLALAVVHHLTLGRGLTLEAAVQRLAALSKRALVMEFVAKEDPLILGEPEFFPAYHKNPQAFGWYTADNWLRQLALYFGEVRITDSVKGRQLFICSQRKAG